jgi:hypothetical protein
MNPKFVEFLQLREQALRVWAKADRTTIVRRRNPVHNCMNISWGLSGQEKLCLQENAVQKSNLSETERENDYIFK